MVHPDIVNRWQCAKRAAAAIAACMGAEMLQTADGAKRVIYGGKPHDFPTWLAAYSFVSRVRADQLRAKALA